MPAVRAVHHRQRRAHPAPAGTLRPAARRTAALNLRTLPGRGLARRDGAWILASGLDGQAPPGNDQARKCLCVARMSSVAVTSSVALLAVRP